jgi:hypothetical protein
MDFPGFNFQWEILWTGSMVGGALGSMVDRCAQGRWCSLIVAGEGEEDEAELEAGSPEHKQWRRGDAMAVEDGGGSSSVRERRRAREC